MVTRKFVNKFLIDKVLDLGVADTRKYHYTRVFRSSNGELWVEIWRIPICNRGTWLMVWRNKIYYDEDTLEDCIAYAKKEGWYNED